MTYAIVTPPTIPVAFGASAGSGYINTPISATPPGTPGAVSWSVGFDPANYILPGTSGSISVAGQDIAGVLHDLSAHAVWHATGQKLHFDSGFATQTGYPIGAIIQLDAYPIEVVSLIANNSVNPNTTSGALGVSWGLYKPSQGAQLAAYAALAYSGSTTLNLQTASQFYDIVAASGNWNLNVNWNGSIALGAAPVGCNFTLEMDTVIGASLFNLGTFSIDGVVQSVKWVGAAGRPASVANTSQATFFRMLRVAGGWFVTAQLQSIA